MTTDGTECQGTGETLGRLEEWTKECFRKEHNSLKPKIEHIDEQEWEKPFTQAPKDLQDIRERAELTQTMKNKPGIETWIHQDYTEQDIDSELGNIALEKSTWK